jgi:putative phosphoesterase
MRIAILADIHGNLRALNAVVADIGARKPDVVFVAGDTINRGAMPRACLELVLQKQRDAGWRVIRGNHEDYVLTEANPPPARPDWLVELCRHSAWTCEQVRDYLGIVSALPHQSDLDAPANQHVRCVHASMRGNRVGLYEGMADDEMHELVGLDPDVLCVGHTHVPFIRRLNNRLVVNAGAVGMPFDGDPRASYAIIEWIHHHWHAQIVRLDYDRDVAARDFVESGFLAGGGAFAPVIHREFERARPLCSRWHRDYEAVVAGGQRDIFETMRELLAKS